MKHLSGWSLAIIGMPRSGSTIVTSYLSSLPKTLIFGEPHRASSILSEPTKFGEIRIDPEQNILRQIRKFAHDHDLWIHGFKEVWDPRRGTCPIQLVNGYGDDLDHVLVTIRDPRRNFSSMASLGHLRGVSMGEFVDTYCKLVLASQENDRFHPVVLESFRKNPEATMQAALGIDPSKFDLEHNYVGGGDPNAMKSKKILRNDYRPRYTGPGLEEADKAFQSILRPVG